MKFNTGIVHFDEMSLREKLEYEEAQLEILEMDIANTKLRIANVESKLELLDEA